MTCATIPKPTKPPIFTFIDLRAVAILALGLVLVSSPCPAQPEELSLSASAIERGDKKNADFWLARYLGLWSRSVASNQAALLPGDVEPILAKRRLEPEGFLSGGYSASFLNWFEYATFEKWGVESSRVRERYGSMEIGYAGDENYFVTVTASPLIQTWFTSSDTGLGKSRRLVLAAAVAEGADRPMIYAGRLVNKVTAVTFKPVELDVKKHALLYLWTPELHDVDADGIPEVWLRYNVAWGNGFAQILDIYRIEDDTLKLWKKFEGLNEGIARRLGGNTVELGQGFGSRPTLAHLDYDRHRLEIWEYEAGDFHKSSEKQVEHLLKSDAWIAYY